MEASAGLEAMKRFCNAVVSVYSATALRHPNLEDINRLLDKGQQNGFQDVSDRLIACIGSGKITRPRGRACFRARLVPQLLFWRRLLTTIADSGTSISDHREL
jgi:hypothetical protein